MKFDIIDCTLRDGGYITNWNFGYNNIKYIINKLGDSKIDMIEIGFLESDFNNDKLNYSKYSNNLEINEIVNDCKYKDNCIFMIMHNKVKYDDLLDLNFCLVKKVRYCFKKNEIEDAFKNCYILYKQGFQIFLQPAAIHEYTEAELEDLIEKTNCLSPSAISIVDTYGLLLPDSFNRIVNIFNENLNKNINIGIHSHNNLQLSLYNAISILDLNLNRKIYIDTCVLGIGRGAGNLCTELAIHVLDKEKKYSLDPIIDIIDNCFSVLKEEKQWGYSIEYFMTAYHRRHPNDILHIVDKDIKKINQILGLKKIKAVIFDFDGTIADTSLGIKKAIRYVENKLGLARQTEENLLNHIGPPIEDAYKKSYDLENELLAEAINLHKEYLKKYGYKELEIYKGVFEVLNYLKNNHYLIGIATLKSSNITNKIIEFYKLNNYFDKIIGSDEGKYKTKDEILNECIIKLNCDKNEVIFVGDSIYDYNAASKLGVSFLSVGYGFGFKKDDVNNVVKIDCLESNQLLSVIKKKL